MTQYGLLPVFIHRFGIKKMFLLRMLTWALRYALFAFGNVEGLVFMLLIGIALHGASMTSFSFPGRSMPMPGLAISSRVRFKA